MAPAVRGRPGPPPDPEPTRHRSRSWRGEDVQLADVLSNLNRLHAELGHEDAEQEDHPHPRNCVLCLVIVTGQEASLALACDRFAATVASQHPLRAIVVHDDPWGEDRLDAEVASHAVRLLRGAPVQREQIVLHVGGQPGQHLPSLLEPLLVPDVPAYLWWMGTPPLTEEVMLTALEAVQVLVVDSSSFQRPFAAFLDLAELARTMGSRLSIGDLHWERLRPWREVIAQFFAAPDRRPFLDGLGGVGVDYAGEGRGNRVGAALIAGWLQSALRWRLRRAVAGPGGIVEAYLEAPHRHPVEVTLRSVAAEGAAAGDLEAIRLEGAANGRMFSLTIRRDPQDRTLVDVSSDLGGGDVLRQLISLPVSDEGELLLRLIAQGRRDPVYTRSLQSAGELLAATR